MTQLTEDEQFALLARCPVNDGQRWRNNKTGDLYVVLCVALEATNNRPRLPVVLYVKRGDASVSNVRDVSEFIEKFTREL